MYGRIIKCGKCKKLAADRWKEERMFLRIAYLLGDARKAAIILTEYGISEKRLYSILVKWEKKGIYHFRVSAWSGYFDIENIMKRNDKYTEVLGRWVF